MSKREIRTYVYTCDLCGTEVPEGSARTLRDNPNYDTGRGAKTVDVCKECQSRPISDLLAKLDEGTIKVKVIERKEAK